MVDKYIKEQVENLTNDKVQDLYDEEDFSFAHLERLKEEIVEDILTDYELSDNETDELWEMVDKIFDSAAEEMKVALKEWEIERKELEDYYWSTRGVV